MNLNFNRGEQSDASEFLFSILQKTFEITDNICQLFLNKFKITRKCNGCNAIEEQSSSEICWTMYLTVMIYFNLNYYYGLMIKYVFKAKSDNLNNEINKYLSLENLVDFECPKYFLLLLIIILNLVIIKFLIVVKVKIVQENLI